MGTGAPNLYQVSACQGLIPLFRICTVAQWQSVGLLIRGLEVRVLPVQRWRQGGCSGRKSSLTNGWSQENRKPCVRFPNIEGFVTHLSDSLYGTVEVLHTGCGQVWYAACFGYRRTRVQIFPSRRSSVILMAEREHIRIKQVIANMLGLIPSTKLLIRVTQAATRADCKSAG